ncbi:MAG: MBL fold metallo-hydrolase [Actinomycetota bacterium]|nr:MBL fold metallo-hydrolase [Actinomycetota bacterium]
MRLTARVHLVGGGASGFDLTDRWDAHAYLVDGGGGEAALVDAGCGGGVDMILANVAAAGVAADSVRFLLLTHAHPDHSGGAARLKQRLPHLQVVASPQVARWVATGDEQAMSLEAGKRAEFYPPDFRFPPCPVDIEVDDGDRIDVGGVQLEVAATPGHSDGHVSYLARGRQATVLFGGDLVFYGGQISLLHTWDCRIQAYASSMARLRGAGVDALLPGHHSLSLHDGQRHIDTANRRFDRGFVPPSIV